MTLLAIYYTLRQGRKQRPLIKHRLGIYVNIALYVYTPHQGDAEIALGFCGGEVVIELSDRGMPYNPIAQERPKVLTIPFSYIIL